MFVLLFAIIACAFAIPAALPQPQSPGESPLEQRQSIENREIEPLEAAVEQNQDLKGSSSYGYGFYGYPGYGYPGLYRPYYYGSYGYPNW